MYINSGQCVAQPSKTKWMAMKELIGSKFMELSKLFVWISILTSVINEGMKSWRATKIIIWRNL